MNRRDPEPLDAFVEIRCLCGRLHTMAHERASEGAGLRRWRCGTCKRRFILSDVPTDDGSPGALWPIFLDGVPSTGDTRQEGTTLGDDMLPPPDHLRFTCRCGCRMVAKGKVHGGGVVCPRCKSRLVLKVGSRPEDGAPLAILDYPDDGVLPT